ncbi:MAG: gfo/Idh/MocA family oxidoreductase, partial [Cyanothece sp. SIO1E1]|nr:gfo/Idh/MocA family oxidoreductase [Cyanothece sp. SIO1E1]
DAEDIAAAAKAHSKPVMVGFNRRFYSSVATVLADIDTRDEARYVRIQDQQSYEEARRYNHPEEVVERFMYANSIHVIDLIRAICRGRVVDVNPIKPWMGEQTEVVLVYITFDSGDCALYEGLWKGPGPWAAAVSTPARRWLMQPLEDAAFQNAGERTRQERLRDQIDVDFKPGFFRQAEAVVASVRGQESAAVSIDQSLETMRLINRMFGV